MEPDALLPARLQFAFTIAVHIIFPAFTIGSSAYVATLLVLWRRTGQEHFHRLARFWTRIFAVSFAMGVVSGIPLSYQFGSNWSRFSEVVGNVVGPLIGYEVLTAFFLEATFLGVMLFGWRRVPPWLHVTSALLVALGTTMSGFWILAANSWMQTPAGHVIRDGIAYPADWWAIIFNPSFPYRFVHMMTAAYLTTSVVVLAVGARYLLAGNFQTEAKTMMRMGLGMVAILAPLQLLFGDQHGLNTLQHQPIKVAAMEGHWEDDGPAALVLFGMPDQKAEKNHFEIAIPRLGERDPHPLDDGPCSGAEGCAAGGAPARRERVLRVPDHGGHRTAAHRARPRRRVSVVAQACVRDALVSALRRLCVARGIHCDCLPDGSSTECGRQPYVAYGILRTADAISPVAAPTVWTSLIAFVVVYLTVFSIGVYYIRKLIRNGPKGCRHRAARSGPRAAKPAARRCAAA